MNSEILQYLIEHPDEVDEIKARELEEVSLRFPFYDVPLILLSRYYYRNRDYRYTGTLEKCALRVNDRSWLKSFVESELIFRKPDPDQSHALADDKTLLVETAAASDETEEAEEAVYIQEQINRVIEEAGIDAPVSEQEKEVLTETDVIPEPQPEIAELTPTEVTLSETEPLPTEALAVYEVKELKPRNAEEEDIAVTDIIQETLAPEVVAIEEDVPATWSSQADFDELAAMPVNLESEGRSEEAVYEEIQDFDTEPSYNSFTEATGSEVTEMVEVEDESETPVAVLTQPEELAVEEAPALNEEDSAGVLDFVAHFALAKPSFEPIVEEVEQKTEEPKPQTKQSRKPISVSGLMKGASYNIEDYFDEDNTSGESIETVANDFFSWLSHPSRQERKVLSDSEESDQRKKQARDLINRFIASNPQVQRPKAEFFTPQSESKKSEEMPDDLMTETLAAIYHKQGNHNKAIKIYEALMLKMPEKSAYFASLIQKIKESNHQ